MTRRAGGAHLSGRDEGNAGLDKGLYIQMAASAAAVAALVALAAWARIAKPMTPLDETKAKALFQMEFPDRSIEAVWVSIDGCGALAKSGSAALVLCQTGDGYVARHIPWATARNATVRHGTISLELGDVAAPRAVLALPAWPPQDLAA